MPEHVIVKPEQLAQAAAVALSEGLVIPATFQRESFDRFRGSKNDAVNVKVRGVLPHRTYGWRNDRSTDIQFDQITERTIQVTFGDDIYSGVDLTDEQATMDVEGWTEFLADQTEAVGRGLEYESVNYLEDAPYVVRLGVSTTDLKGGLIKARGYLNKMAQKVAGRRTLLVGTDWEAALLGDDKLNLASNVGESEAVTALREATLGRRFGFDIVVAQELAPTDAYAYIDSAFIMVTGAPAVPQSAAFGASASYDGIALRWVRDFEIKKLRELSVVNAYKGFRHVVDPLIGVDNSNQGYLSDYEHFVRGIKLTLHTTANDATTATSLPDGENGRTGVHASLTAARDDEFAQITGIGTPAP